MTLQEWSHRLNVPIFTDLLSCDFIANRTPLLPYAFVYKHHILPLCEENGAILVAHANPLNLDALQETRQALGCTIREIFAPLATIEAAIEYSYQRTEETSLVIASLQKSSSSEEEIEGYDLLDTNAESPSIRLLNATIIEAIQQGASDIHFEPSEQGLSIRYRIDGALQPRHAPPKEYQSQVLTRIKVLAKLDIAEHRLPQDGRMKLRLGGRHIDFRVSTIPCVFGERIVLRILDKSNVLLGLSKIGMRPSLLETITSLIRYPEGIVLVTGPTGSGKTTTLYSALTDILSPHVNIMTIEDPVEYKLPGLAQMGVNPKIHLHFATGLRHILRQDPDVIMVGEIRDKETAEIAIQASLTGHLVLSTLHTNDAPSALTRLVDMGIAPYLLTSSVIGIIAQRLVRALCKFCKTSYTPSLEELSALRLQEIHKPFFRATGCEHCFHSGYKGRLGIYEFLPMTHQIKQQLLHSADAYHLQKIAISLGMHTLLEEGSLLVIEGLTSSEELLRVTRNCEE